MAGTTAQQPVTGTTGSSGILRPLLVTLATIGTITINILAASLPLNNIDTGAISDQFDVYFVPAGYVFAIWGVIYIGWIAYTVYQWLPQQRESELLKSIAPWYILSAVANSTWLFAWHYLRFSLSLVIIIVLLLSLIQVYRLLAAKPPTSRGAFWALHLPFSVYLAWASVATIANATSVLSLTEWNGGALGPATWGAIMVGVATLLGLAFSYYRADIGFVAVFIWALVGIAYKHSDTPIMLWSAAVGALLLALSLFFTVPNRRRQMAAATIASPS
jgi:hypothetical protein